MDMHKSSDFIGKTVTTSEGRVVGQIQEIVIDADDWRICDLQVKVEKATAKEMGLRTPLLGSLLILIETSRVQSATDQIVVDLAVDDFKGYVKGRKS